MHRFVATFILLKCELYIFTFFLALETDLNILMPKLFSLAREDTEHVVVIACLETLQNVVNKLKQTSFYGGNLESMCSLIKDVFSNKVIFASLFL